MEWVYSFLKQGPDDADLAQCLSIKGHILSEMDHASEAVAASRAAIELFAAEHQKGCLPEHQYDNWIQTLIGLAFYLSCLGQSQEAEWAYMEALKTPKLPSRQKIACLKGLTTLYWKRKDWPKLREYTH